MNKRASSCMHACLLARVPVLACMRECMLACTHAFFADFCIRFSRDWSVYCLHNYFVRLVHAPVSTEIVQGTWNTLSTCLIRRADEPSSHRASCIHSRYQSAPS